MSFKKHIAGKVWKALTGGSKTSPTITSVPISPNLTKKFKAKQDIFKTVDEAAGPHVSSQKKSKIKTEAGKKVSKIFDKSEVGKKNIKEIETLIKAAGVTATAGAGAAGVSLYNKKKKK